MAIPLDQRVIMDARTIVSDPKRWTHGAFGRDAAGTWCRDDNPAAVAFCAEGALRRAARNLGVTHDFRRILNIVQCLSPNGHIAGVNDGPNGRRAVIAIFNEALKYLRS